MANRLRVMCAGARAAGAEEIRWVREALSADAGEVILLVPAQYTLQAEMDVLDACAPEGSFRLQVCSPQRLYGRVFEQAGFPPEARIDEQGRVMLVQAAAAKRQEELIWYAGACRRPGFAERAVAQIALFKQAGFDPDAIRGLAQETQGALAGKLRDIALLYEAYEAALAGRYMDGEDEAARAAERFERAPFLRDARVLCFGFDLISPTVARVLVRLTRAARSVSVLAACERGDDAPRLYDPPRFSLNRLCALARGEGVECEWADIPDPPPRPNSALSHLARALFDEREAPFAGKVTDVQLAALKSPRDEARMAAAVCRRLCRARGWRYRDIAVACISPNGQYALELNRAFALHGVPLFQAQSRPADRNAVCAYLLSALDLVTRGWRREDMDMYLRSGFTGLTDDEADRFVNHIAARGLKGRAFTRPLYYGPEEEIAALEPLRLRAVEPLMILSAHAGKAESARALAACAFDFLEQSRAFDRLEEKRRALEAAGLYLWAMEGAQAMNRITSALDQIVELLGEEQMTLRAFAELIRRALAATEIRALPQSSDAVECGPVEHLKGKKLKALLLIGASEEGAKPGAALLDERESGLLAAKSDCWPGLTAADRSKLRRLSVKGLTALPEDYLLITYPLTDASGGALAPGALVRAAQAILPALRARMDAPGDAAIGALRLESAAAAFCMLPQMLREGDPAAAAARAALSELPDWRADCERMRRAEKHRVLSEDLPPALAKKVYGSLASVSASRLERYASCPFRHFAHYALAPEEFEQFELTPRDAGRFYHDALEAYIGQSGRELGAMTPEDGMRRMDAITALLSRGLLPGAMGESAVARAEAEKLRGVARRAADIIARQFDGSRFRPVSVEADIARGRVRVARDGEASLSGRIDRVDAWSTGDTRYLRVVDYKLGGKTVSLSEIFHGLTIQLIIYLAAALERYGGTPAGVFYFGVADPIIETDERDPEAVEAARERELRLDGLALRDEDVVRAMAASPERVIASVSYKKDGTMGKSARLLDAEDFSALIGHTLRTAQGMIERVKAGDTRVAPYKLGIKTPCPHCEYAALCGFEENLPGAQYRRLESLSAEDAVSLAREEQAAEADTAP